MCMAGAMMQKEGTSEEEFYNMTNELSYDNPEYNFTQFHNKSNNNKNPFIGRAVYKFADFMMFVGVEGSKEAMEYGYENPKYNFDLAWRLMFVALFAALIVPLLYVILFIGYGINQLYKFIRKKFQERTIKRKEK